MSEGLRLVTLGVGEVRLGVVEGVERREQLHHDVARRAGGRVVSGAGHALAVVLELGLKSLQRVEVLVALAFGLASIVKRLGGVVTRRRHRLVIYNVVAHSSTISASTMSSSSPAGAAGSLMFDFAASS